MFYPLKFKNFLQKKKFSMHSMCTCIYILQACLLLSSLFQIFIITITEKNLKGNFFNENFLFVINRYKKNEIIILISYLQNHVLFNKLFLFSDVNKNSNVKKILLKQKMVVLISEDLLCLWLNYIHS